MFQYDARVIRVIDGDTIVVLVDLGFKTFHEAEIRLRGVNAAELHHPLGPIHKQCVQRILDVSNKIRLETFKVESKVSFGRKEKRSFTRFIGDVYLSDGTFLNEYLEEKWGS